MKEPPRHTASSQPPSRGGVRLQKGRSGQIRFLNGRVLLAIRAEAKKRGCTEEAVRNGLQAELVRAGLGARLDRLISGAGGPSVETLFVIARALKLPMEHFLEEVQ